MKIVTLCGSMRFWKEMQDLAVELETKHGWCVIAPVGSGDMSLSGEQVEALGRAHCRKIDLSDAVYIVNIGGYIGRSVSAEIEYAKAHHKEIMYHEG